jgi:hypothetical protein
MRKNMLSFLLLRAGLAALAGTGSLAFAQSGDPYAELKAHLEALRFQVYANGTPVPGVTGTWSVINEPCSSYVESITPNHSFEGQQIVSTYAGLTIPWADVTSISVSGDSVIVDTPAMQGGNLNVGGPASAQRLKAIMDNLVASCRGVASASPAPVTEFVTSRVGLTSGSGLATRTIVEEDGLVPTCEFPYLPGLSLEEVPVMDGVYEYSEAYFQTPPYDENSGEVPVFRMVVATDPEEPKTWQGLAAQSAGFVIYDSRFAGVTVDAFSLEFDGSAPGGLRARINNSPSDSGLPSVWIEGGEDSPNWFPLLERSSYVTLYLYENDREVGSWTFDVSGVRNVPAALNGAGFSCD